MRETQIPGPENTQKLLKMTPKAGPPKLPEKYSKNTKNSSKIHFLVIFEYFSGNLGGRLFGVIFSNF